MAHKVKVKVPYLGYHGQKGFLIFDADLQTDFLETKDGLLSVDFLGGTIVDCMLDIRNAAYDASKIEQFKTEIKKLRALAEDNFQKEYTVPSTDWRQGNSSGYLAAVDDILGKFNKFFKED